MTSDEVQAAKERALSVVNGFSRVREQNARDALKLAEQCQRYQVVIDRMRREKEIQENPTGVLDEVFPGLFRKRC